MSLRAELKEIILKSSPIYVLRFDWSPSNFPQASPTFSSHPGEYDVSNKLCPLFTSSGNAIEEIPKFTKISLHRIAFEHLHMSILVEDVLVDPSATE